MFNIHCQHVKHYAIFVCKIYNYIEQGNGMNIQKQLGKRISELRKLRGLSQEKLAEKIDIAINTMSNIERGNAFMTAATLEKLIKILKVTPAELFTFEKEEKKTDLYKYLLAKIDFLKDDIEKLKILKKFIDAIT